MTLVISPNRAGELSPLAIPEWQIETAREVRQRDLKLGRLYETATPFFMTADIQRLLVDALDTFPSDTDPEPPCAQGVVWMERKLEIEDGLTRAFVWDDRGSDVSVGTYGSYGILWGKRLSDDERRFLWSFWWFLQQPLVETVTHTGDRAAQRRAARAGRPDPVIRIVQLRAKHYARHPQGEHGEVEYSCRWMVRGHWRNQWYPSRNRNEPLWISPYVKGPDSAPLKRPTTQIFAVTR